MTRFCGNSREVAGKPIRVQSTPDIEIPLVPSLSLDTLRERVRPFCFRHPVQKLEVFGSVARGEAGAESDVDLLVTFEPLARFGMYVFLDLKSELEDLLGCPVDLLERPRRRSQQESVLETLHSAVGSDDLSGKLGAVKFREVLKLIEHDGWFYVRTRGSHHHFHHRVKRGIVTVAGSANDDLPKKTIQSILRQAGLR